VRRRGIRDGGGQREGGGSAAAGHRRVHRCGWSSNGLDSLAGPHLQAVLDLPASRRRSTRSWTPPSCGDGRSGGGDGGEEATATNGKGEGARRVREAAEREAMKERIRAAASYSIRRRWQPHQPKRTANEPRDRRLQNNRMSFSFSLKNHRK